MKTYKQAQKDFLDFLEKNGWKVKRDLKVPYATNPDGSLRFWFKPQALWYSLGNAHTLNGARSTFLDLRTEDNYNKIISLYLEHPETWTDTYRRD